MNPLPLTGNGSESNQSEYSNGSDLLAGNDLFRYLQEFILHENWPQAQYGRRGKLNKTKGKRNICSKKQKNDGTFATNTKSIQEEGKQTYG